MSGNTMINLTKEYLNLVILQYSLAAFVGILIILAGFIAMNTVMWKQIEFWDAQYVYNGTDHNKGRHYVEWLYQTFMTGGEV